ncbi:tRNA pseudouridine(38-40) synthase TruA [Bacteroidota bacterium]
MKNYKLTIQYDGTDFAGWQIQKNAPTIQQRIVDTIDIITKEKVNLIGSGRTDSGVHALGQVANFKTEQVFHETKLLHSLNAILPRSISISKIETVDESFHARFDAKKRSYIYLISRQKSPFFNKYSHLDTRIGDEEIFRLNKLGKYLLGTHDFTSLCRKDMEVKNRECTIYDIHWRKGSLINTFYIQADRYLHGMVRTIVGTLLFCVGKNLDENYLEEIISAKDREAAAEAAPAKGLFLYKVRY